MYVFPIKYKFLFPNIKLLDQNSLSITMEDGDTYYGETKLNNKIVFLTGKLGNYRSSAADVAPFLQGGKDNCGVT